MSFVEKLLPPGESKKSIILCDVNYTLLTGISGKQPNKELITLMNHAYSQGFDVQIVTGGMDRGHFKSDKLLLEKFGLNPEIANTARGKKRIDTTTYSNVVAIIDDDIHEKYIQHIINGNPDAKHFYPRDFEEIIRHLNSFKVRGNIMGAASK